MNKKYIIIILVLLILVLVGGGYYWHWQSKKSGVEVITETANGEVLPSVSTNPLDNKPNVNPIDQTNPYKNIKTNPFE